MLSSMRYDFRFPRTRVVFGVGSVVSLPHILTEIGCNRPMVVTDQGIVRAGILDRIAEVLVGAGIEYSLFEDVEENPSTRTVEEVANRLAQSGCDGLVGLGGGSSMDAAKAAAMLAANGGDLRAYAGSELFALAPRPVVAIPTTAGTGAEVSSVAVVSDTETKRKLAVRGYLMSPAAALLDPSLLTTLPAMVAALTGLDALDHNLSYYVSRVAMPLSEGINERAIVAIMQNLLPFVQDRSNIEAASHMQLAALMGEMTFTRPRLGVCHAMAHALSARLNLSHGMGVAITLPRTLRFNMPWCTEKLARLAKLTGLAEEGWTEGEAAEAFIVAVEDLCEKAGVPRGLSEVGVRREDIRALAQEALERDHVRVNPRPVDLDSMVGLFEQCL